VAPPPLDRYDAVVLDLDGTVWRGSQVLPGARELVAACRRAGRAVAFATNSSVPTRAELVGRLRGMGIPAEPGDLLVAVDATAERLVADGVQGTWVLGGAGLREALAARGLGVRALNGGGMLGRPSPGEGRQAVVVGTEPAIAMADVARAAALVRAGLPVYTTTPEPAYPAETGREAGTGAVLAALRAMAPVEPVVCGKPSPGFAELVARFLDGRRALVVGDTPASDVALARALGHDALLVLTGSAGPGEAYDPEPDFVVEDLSGLGGDGGAPPPPAS
jgi:HAD superfamily hydrolase (TIGR01450 family)